MKYYDITLLNVGDRVVYKYGDGSKFTLGKIVMKTFENVCIKWEDTNRLNNYSILDGFIHTNNATFLV